MGDATLRRIAPAALVLALAGCVDGGYGYRGQPAYSQWGAGPGAGSSWARPGWSGGPSPGWAASPGWSRPRGDVAVIQPRPGSPYPAPTVDPRAARMAAEAAAAQRQIPAGGGPSPRPVPFPFNGANGLQPEQSSQ